MFTMRFEQVERDKRLTQCFYVLCAPNLLYTNKMEAEISTSTEQDSLLALIKHWERSLPQTHTQTQKESHKPLSAKEITYKDPLQKYKIIPFSLTHGLVRCLTEMVREKRMLWAYSTWNFYHACFFMLFSCHLKQILSQFVPWIYLNWQRFTASVKFIGTPEAPLQLLMFRDVR